MHVVLHKKIQFLHLCLLVQNECLTFTRQFKFLNRSVRQGFVSLTTLRGKGRGRFRNAATTSKQSVGFSLGFGVEMQTPADWNEDIIQHK